jgi:hypothetical protein
MSRHIQINERVVYDGLLQSLNGKAGHFLRPAQTYLARPHGLVRFDYDGRERVVKMSNLVPEQEYNDMSRLKNFKTIVADAFTKLIEPVSTDSPKEVAVRKLGVAYELVRLAEDAKKRAKKALADVGIDVTKDFAPGTSEVVFDSERYVMTAVTNAGSERLSEDALRVELTKLGYGSSVIAQIVANSKAPTKPSTSLKIDAK